MFFETPSRLNLYMNIVMKNFINISMNIHMLLYLNNEYYNLQLEANVANERGT